MCATDRASLVASTPRSVAAVAIAPVGATGLFVLAPVGGSSLVAFPCHRWEGHRICVSRPFRRSHALRPARSPSRPTEALFQNGAPVHFVTSRNRSDHYRLKRKLPVWSTPVGVLCSCTVDEVVSIEPILPNEFPSAELEHAGTPAHRDTGLTPTPVGWNRSRQCRDLLSNDGGSDRPSYPSGRESAESTLS